MNDKIIYDRNDTESVEETTYQQNKSGDISLPFSLRREYSKSTLRAIQKRIHNRAYSILAERALEGLLK